MWVSIGPEWQGQSCHIIAGGPSLAGVDLSRLRGRRVIAVNKAGFLFPFADVMFFADRRFIKEYNDRLLAFMGEAVTTCGLDLAKPFMQLRQAPAALGISPDRDAAAIKFTGLQAAINIAVHKGCERIVLHGADMKTATDGRMHFHDGYPPDFTVSPGWEQRMIADLGHCVAPLASLGVQVVTANPDSGLPHWPKMGFDEALAWAV